MAPTTFPEKPRAPPAGLPSFWINRADGRYWRSAHIKRKTTRINSGARTVVSSLDLQG